ncbi:MAG: nucleotidyltransferase [Chitinivibrionia bacterium]|jgi:predicted nucleotidyltransferase|nr:nucleotidyltransferase [Chitinivibrionia bacterium]
MKAEIELVEDFKDMFKEFNKQGVKYVLVGGLATILYGYQRLTQDLDLFILANSQNAELVMKALIKYGAPMEMVSKEDFEKEGTTFQMGVKPNRIDILTAISGIKFDEVYKNAIDVEVDELEFKMISIEDLIKNKLASGRKRDLDDVENLEEILLRRKGL